MKLSRPQLEAHLTLHGWQPAENINNHERTFGKRAYGLRNDGQIASWINGVANLDETASPGYFINDQWRFCEWAAIPGPQLRRMVEKLGQLVVTTDCPE